MKQFDTPQLLRSSDGVHSWKLSDNFEPKDFQSKNFIHYSGKSRYWVENLLTHRIDGPAEEWSDGTKRWLRQGKLHREDGPAIEYSTGLKCWYLEGNNYTEREWQIELNKRGIPYCEDYGDGDKRWMLNNKLHRLDGPAHDFANGYKGWFVNGKEHKEDGPARTWADGREEYWLEGKYYVNKTDYNHALKERKNISTSPAFVPTIPENTSICHQEINNYWRLPNGKLHRENGPAVELANGTKEWWKNGQRHRIDGPAMEYGDGNKEWWVNGELHREDGPAVEHLNGNKLYYLNNQKYYYEDWKAVKKLHDKTKKCDCSQCAEFIKNLI